MFVWNSWYNPLAIHSYVPCNKDFDVSEGSAIATAAEAVHLALRGQLYDAARPTLTIALALTETHLGFPLRHIFDNVNSLLW